jgi:N-methylhydantoinase B
MVLIMPVFTEGEIVAWTADIAHWNDVGGMVPGSMSTDATEIFQEGMIYPGVKLIAEGEPIQAVFDILTANCRMPDFLIGDLWAGVAAVRVGERRIKEIVKKYGKDVFLYALEQYMDFGEQVSLAALKKLPKGTFSLEEEQDSGQIYAVTIEVKDDEFIVDLRDNPDQDSGPFNMSADEAVVSCQMAFKNITAPDRVATGGTFRPLKVLLRHGTVFNPAYPAAMGIYYEIGMRLHDLIMRCLAPHMPERVPAGGFSSICGTLFGGIHPDTGRPYAVIEPELGGWGGSHLRDGMPGQYSPFHGETYNCPAEVAEARYGVTVDYLSFHDEDGGAGLHRGGKGVRIDYRIRSDNAWLTVAYTRSIVPPWPLNGGQPGSPNHIVVRRASGEKEKYAVVSGLTLNTDDVIQVMTSTGAGWGDPMARDQKLIEADVKNGYISLEQANSFYGYDKRGG